MTIIVRRIQMFWFVILIISLSSICSGQEFRTYARESLEAHVDQSGVGGLASQVESLMLESVARNNLSNLVIAGETGSGKSSLVNALMGRYPNQEGAATVGSTDSTIRAAEYVSLNYRLMDLPGLNTPNFSRESYADDVHLNQFDGLVICVGSRFTDNDLWLATEAQRNNIPCVFARTMINLDIENYEYETNKTDVDHEIMDQIRQNIQGHLRNDDLPAEPLFLLSTRLHYRDKWEFPLFEYYLTNKFEKVVLYERKHYLTDVAVKLMKRVRENLEHGVTHSILCPECDKHDTMALYCDAYNLKSCSSNCGCTRFILSNIASVIFTGCCFAFCFFLLSDRLVDAVSRTFWDDRTIQAVCNIRADLTFQKNRTINALHDIRTDRTIVAGVGGCLLAICYIIINRLFADTCSTEEIKLALAPYEEQAVTNLQREIKQRLASNNILG